MKQRNRASRPLLAVFAALALVLAPAGAASASYYHDLGSGSCTTATAFIRSNSTGYTAHYRQNVMLASWNNSVFGATRQSSMARTWSAATVTGQDGGTATPAHLSWAYTGCGGV